MKKKAVIMDVDKGIDDALAMALAHSCNHIDILGISTVGGSISLHDNYKNTTYVANKLGMRVPVVKGLEQALIDDGLNSTDSVTDLFTFYETLLSQAEQEVTIITTGPLTNIAAILLAQPHLKEKIGSITMLGGAINLGNVTATAEFNVHKDPEAAEIIMKSGVPIVLVPLDVRQEAYITVDEIKWLKSMMEDEDHPLLHLLDHYLAECAMNPELPGGLLDDTLVVGHVIDPEIFTHSSFFVTVDMSESSTRGTTMVDRYGRLGKEANVELLETINRDAFIKMTINCLEGSR